MAVLNPLIGPWIVPEIVEPMLHPVVQGRGIVTSERYEPRVCEIKVAVQC